MFVLRCTTILIGTCATRTLPFSLGQNGHSTGRHGAAAGPNVQPSPAASVPDSTQPALNDSL